MNIAVIGGNGRSGQQFVSAALAAGHTVRAGILGKRYLQTHPSLTIQECEATNASQIAELIKGQDAVVSLIGHVKGSPPTVQTDAMQVLVDEMHKCGMQRLVILTGTGVRFPGDAITLMDRVLNIGVRLVDPNRVLDGIASCAVLEKSSLDWTIIRVLKLTERSPTAFQLKEHGPAKSFISRQEVALAILQVLEGQLYIQEAPIISTAG